MLSGQQVDKFKILHRTCPLAHLPGQKVYGRDTNKVGAVINGRRKQKTLSKLLGT